MSCLDAEARRAYARQWTQRQLEQGLCAYCSNPRHPESKRRCPACLEVARRHNRAYHRSLPWQPGRRGRKPLDSLPARADTTCR